MTGSYWEQRLRILLAETYTPEGIEVWLADAEKKGLTMEEKLKRALAAAEGTFA